MSQPNNEIRTELHLFSQIKADEHVEVLTAIAHYQRSGNSIGLGDTVNFGRPWVIGSKCDYGLISLPYLDGPSLEVLDMPEINTSVRCLWLVPITKAELDYKKRYGVEALEHKLEESQFNYLDAERQSVV
jgi:hypothetical protein